MELTFEEGWSLMEGCIRADSSSADGLRRAGSPQPEVAISFSSLVSSLPKGVCARTLTSLKSFLAVFSMVSNLLFLLFSWDKHSRHCEGECCQRSVLHLGGWVVVPSRVLTSFTPTSIVFESLSRSTEDSVGVLIEFPRSTLWPPFIRFLGRPVDQEGSSMSIGRELIVFVASRNGFLALFGVAILKSLKDLAISVPKLSYTELMTAPKTSRNGPDNDTGISSEGHD